jgi:nitrite reductase/ring-hydroxylating ferredoxin subunit
MLSRVLILTFLLITACDRDLTDDPIPIVPFPNSTINLYLPEYQPLVVDGGFKIISNVNGISIGVRGIILYRKDVNNYFAYEINCSYHPNEAGSNVSPHASRLYMNCSGCGSNFSFTDGTPTGGVAWRPLRRYRTELSGGYLTITNEIL